MAKSKDQLKIGVLLSYLNLAISSIIPFVYTPVMLRILGQNEYGLFSLAHTAIGYLSLLTFGFGGTILRYLSIYRAKGQKEEEEKTLGFFLLLYSYIAVLIMLGGIILLMLTYSSPQLIAVSCVLLRLLVPRHSPCALCSLTIFIL